MRVENLFSFWEGLGKTLHPVFCNLYLKVLQSVHVSEKSTIKFQLRVFTRSLIYFTLQVMHEVLRTFSLLSAAGGCSHILWY